MSSKKCNMLNYFAKLYNINTLKGKKNGPKKHVFKPFWAFTNYCRAKLASSRASSSTFSARSSAKKQCSSKHSGQWFKCLINLPRSGPAIPSKKLAIWFTVKHSIFTVWSMGYCELAGNTVFQALTVLNVQNFKMVKNKPGSLQTTGKQPKPRI